jgi:hypothetical protein
MSGLPNLYDVYKAEVYYCLRCSIFHSLHFIDVIYGICGKHFKCVCCVSGARIKLKIAMPVWHKGRKCPLEKVSGLSEFVLIMIL